MVLFIGINITRYWLYLHVIHYVLVTYLASSSFFISHFPVLMLLLHSAGNHSFTLCIIHSFFVCLLAFIFLILKFLLVGG